MILTDEHTDDACWLSETLDVATQEVLMRIHGKTDVNHRMIVSALREHGASVQSLASLGNGAPDLLVLWQGVFHLLEVKSSTKAKLTPLEEKWHIQFQCKRLHVVVTVEDALRAVGIIGKDWNGTR